LQNFTTNSDNILLHLAANQLKCQHCVGVAWNYSLWIPALRSQPQRHFHEMDGFTSQLTPQSLSLVLCWVFSEAWYIDWLMVLS